MPINTERIRSCAMSFLWKSVAKELPEGPLKWEAVGMSNYSRWSEAYRDDHLEFQSKVLAFCSEYESGVAA